MAWTATTLRAALDAYVQSDETTYVAYRDTFITQAEDRIYKSVILPANRKNTSVTLTSGDPTAAVPSDFLAPFEFRVNSSSGNFSPVLFTDVSMMRELYPNPLMVGTPRIYSLFDSGTLVMSPTPTTGLVGWLNYFYKPQSITVTSTSWLGSHAENCLLYACLVEAYTFLKGEPDLMKTYEDKYQAALADLRKLGEGSDMGDAMRMGEIRIGNKSP